MLVVLLALLPFQSSTCNDQARTQTSSAGATITGSVPCMSVTATVSVPGGSNITVSSPASCPIGSREQDADCFDCGPSSPGNHCNAAGFKAQVTVYSAGNANTCPEIPTTLPKTLSEFNSIFKCQTLSKLNSEPVVCAKVIQCDLGEPEQDYTSGQLIQDAFGSRTAWYGDPTAQVPVAQPNPVAVFLDQAALPVSQLPQELQGVKNTYPATAGVRLTARVMEAFTTANSSSVHEEWRIEGVLLPDQRYCVEIPFLAQDPTDGSQVAFLRDLAYDGVAFMSGSRGAPEYHAYPVGHPDFSAIIEPQTRFLEQAAGWVEDPFSIWNLDGSAYSVGPTDPVTGLFDVVETYPGVQSGLEKGSKVYWIDASSAVPHPVRVEVLNDALELVERQTFEDFRTLSPDVWRPFSIRVERFSAGASTPWFVQTTSIVEARELTPAEAAAETLVPASPTGWWMIHHD